jgi:hypothetical protein
MLKEAHPEASYGGSGRPSKPQTGQEKALLLGIEIVRVGSVSIYAWVRFEVNTDRSVRLGYTEFLRIGVVPHDVSVGADL